METKVKKLLYIFVSFTLIFSSCKKDKIQFLSPDLMTFNLKGPVEQVNTEAHLTNIEGSIRNYPTLYKENLRFNSNYRIRKYKITDNLNTEGRIKGGYKNFSTWLDYSGFWKSVERDSLGRLSSFEKLFYEGDASVWLKYWYGDNRVDSINWCGTYIRYKYDAKGNQTGMLCTQYDVEIDTTIKLIVEFKKTNNDKYGNWTERVSRCRLEGEGDGIPFYVLEERTITYTETEEDEVEKKETPKKTSDELSKFYGKWKNTIVTGKNEWLNTYYTINRDGSGDINSVIHREFGNQPGLNLHFDRVIVQGNLLMFCNDKARYNSCPRLRITGDPLSPLETMDGGLVTRQ